MRRPKGGGRVGTVVGVGILLVVALSGAGVGFGVRAAKGDDLDAGTGPVCDSNRVQGGVRGTAGTRPARACSNRCVLRGGGVKRAGTGPVTISNRGGQREARDAGTGPAIVISNRCEWEGGYVGARDKDWSQTCLWPGQRQQGVVKTPEWEHRGQTGTGGTQKWDKETRGSRVECVKSGLFTSVTAEGCPTTVSQRKVLTRARDKRDILVGERVAHVGTTTRSEKRGCPRPARDVARGLTEEIERLNGKDCTTGYARGVVTRVTTGVRLISAAVLTKLKVVPAAVSSYARLIFSASLPTERSIIHPGQSMKKSAAEQQTAKKLLRTVADSTMHCRWISVLL
eukprot:708846-Rhodomonas_salina.1